MTQPPRPPENTGFGAAVPAPREVPGETTRLTSRSRKGLVGRNWWAQEFSRILGDIGLPDRLHRARALARAGGVVGFRMATGHLSAEIRQPRNLPREAEIEIPVFSPADQEKIVEVFASRGRWSAELLLGHLSEEATQLLEQRGVALLPRAWSELRGTCGCEDPSPVCPHAAAVFYLAVERIDRDPHRLFELRGLDREDFLRRCREARVSKREAALRSAGAQPPDDAELARIHEGAGEDGEENLGPGEAVEVPAFWGRGEDLRSIIIDVEMAGGDPPILARLGLPPSVEEDSIPEIALRDAYRFANKAVREIAEGIGIELRTPPPTESLLDPEESPEDPDEPLPPR